MQNKTNSCPHVCIHSLSPLGAVDSHQEDDGAARKTDKAEDGEEPPIADAANDRGSDDGTDAGEDVSHEVVESYTLRGLFRHEFGEHGGYHTENEHGAHTKEEVGNHLSELASATNVSWGLYWECTYRDKPEDSLLRRPTIPNQGCWVHESTKPCILTHSIFWS